MTKVILTQGFEEDLDQVISNKVLLHILEVVALLEGMPTMGSRDVPQSIKQDFGDQVRKIPVNPFDLITLFDESENTVTVVGLIHQRAAW